MVLRGYNMSIIIQKYGGTSVSTPEGRERVAHHVMDSVNEGNNVVVVVSAMGRMGDPYATDSLINIYDKTGVNRDARQLDLLMSCGEVISSVIICATIGKNGGSAIALTGRQAGILTDSNYGSANVISIDVNNIKKYLDQGIIPVVTGFQGVAENGDITTLGRGGSDTTAALLGEALNADKIEIYTDVDGIMTADPRLVENARKISKLDYEECYQMSVDGAKVIDSKAVEVARRSGKNLVIKNTFSDNSGTIISSLERPTAPKMEERIFTAITAKNDIVQYEIDIKAQDKRVGIILDRFEKSEISLDLINFFEDTQVFTVINSDCSSVENILAEYKISYKKRDNCCKLTAIGYKIHGVPGVMKRIVLALSKIDVKILQSGDSNTTIAILIDRLDLKKSMQQLHDEFNLG